MDSGTQITGTRSGTTRFPLYDGAVYGFEGFWYPVMFGADLRERRSVSIELFGKPVMFFRERGKAYALHDRCPHRGVPLSLGRQEFPGTLTCRYHGWTYDLVSGMLVAALTDGPDSPMCGKASVQTYPVEERAGILWIFHGAGDPPPVETHIPEEMLARNAVVEGRITTRPGDWRYGAENGFDESHGKYLHRDSLMVFFSHPPAYVRTEIGPDDWHWITRKTTQAVSFAHYPGLGEWPKRRFWKTRRSIVRVSIALPGVLRVHYGTWIHFEWYVPTKEGEHRYLQFVVKHASGVGALAFRLWYWLILRWVFHVQFNDQDASMVELMRTPPEQLFGPDHSLIAWRRLCEEYAVDATGKID
ncbi:MAG TPA: aromatic ring-hydroxylating dioxygenase subunit alpha [Candidatus Acidoferrales bacterium]|nr:aromatic ring-hydroxylating dioxygenase subunit alpha [Candidatus Acidoferrales bacterium]